MKKSELKTGMIIEFDSKKFGNVLLNTRSGDIIAGEDTWFSLMNYDSDLRNWEGDIKVKRIYQPRSNANYLNLRMKNHDLLWERAPEKTYELDGVEYSESTLRSIIKKATE